MEVEYEDIDDFIDELIEFYAWLQEKYPVDATIDLRFTLGKIPVGSMMVDGLTRANIRNNTASVDVCLSYDKTRCSVFDTLGHEYGHLIQFFNDNLDPKAYEQGYLCKKADAFGVVAAREYRLGGYIV
jgi:hypothetical protein